MQQQPLQYSSSCHRPLSRASRQLFRKDASSILLHYFGGKGQDAPWRRYADLDALSSDSTTTVDPTVDKQGRKRERIRLVDDPYDGLADEEWYALLGYAIDKSMSSLASDAEKEPITCPLHPKHDMILPDDQNSFLLKRRYRTGVTKFGGHSLPLSGRAARAALWMEEREMPLQEGRLPLRQIQQKGAKSVFLFQCGICDKTFVSRYYLDKHMETHHHPIHDDSDEIDAAGNQSLCPADHVCEALGGFSACVETMDQISAYYGPGMLLGKEYYTGTTSETLLSTSVKSLISNFYQSGDDDQIDDTDDIPVSPEKGHKEKQKPPKEGDFGKVFGEMRHRLSRTNKLMMKAVFHKQREKQAKHANGFAEEGASFSDLLNGAQSTGSSISFEDDLHLATPSTSCDEEEMERSFEMCRDMIHTCFGDSESNDAESKLSSGHTPNLARDLIIQICEPLHCHHRLHLIAGHNPRHVGHWNYQWEEHHSYSLGWFGWIVLIGVVIFYGCAYFSGFGGAAFGNNTVLPGHSKKKTKSI